MSASTKSALKAIGASIKSQKFDEAIEQAEKLLASDPQSYQAHIFLGFAFDKQSKPENAEKAYEAATRLKPSEASGWQGLLQLYGQQGAAKLAQYELAATKLAGIYQNLDEKYKCQDVVDKFLAMAKNQGSRLQNKAAQKIVLPGSPVYDYLEGRIPHPAHTFQLMAQITEIDEKERINKEIGERRTRLGAKIGQVTSEVKREIFRESDLEDLYSKIIDWSNDDEIRRQYEEKLLQRCVEVLYILGPGEEKAEKLTNAFKLATDMVIIKHPFKLAWDIAIEWKDPLSIQDLDANILREFCDFFPTSGLAQVLRGFMASEVSPFTPPPPQAPAQTAEIHNSDDSDEDDDDAGGVRLDAPLTAEDRLSIMTEGMSDAPKSILAHRLMGEYYQYLEEYESIVELMRNGQRLVVEQINITGIPFSNSSEAITSLLATALVFYQSPKNHPEAKTLFEGLLARRATSTPALIGIGLIYEEENDYPSAIDFLERALERDVNNVRIRAEAAWVRALHGDHSRGRDELEACLSKLDGKDPRSKDLIAQTQYRIGVCIWNIDTSRAARKDRSGAYSYFLAALKTNLNYAPAYTSLGIFYSDYSKDKKRSRKCFQKAFELSSSEVEAAERLARMFAEKRDWDLVEVVAQRVVDSGKVKPTPGSKRKGISWPFAALGVAELNKQDYAKSIVSFQAALRIKPNDYHSWVGLGESYHNSGRYIAATKAFQHAESFEHEMLQEKSGEVWFAKHMLANVKRELGDFDDAITEYRAVLEERPQEFGVSIALIQSLVDSAWDSIDKGLFGHASQRASETIETALRVSSFHLDAFNLWRAVGDACSVFSWAQSYFPQCPYPSIEKLLRAGDGEDYYTVFSDIDGVGLDLVLAKRLFPTNEEPGLNLTRCLHAAILCQKRAIHASAHDIHAQAVAYYNLGWAEHRSHVCLSAGLKKRSTRYLKAAVRCFKRAIELEAGNSEFWNALGVVTSEISPKVAQHAFVRSLFLNERSPQAWTNLGSLCLLQNDIQLANDAFTRAQSSDPDFAHAWVGQGLIALMTDNPKEADLLFTHAIEISESSSVITMREYANSTFDHILGSKINSSVAELVQPLFALNQLQSMVPGDLASQHLSAQFLERIDNIGSAVQTLSSVCAIVDADYEVTESPDSLSRFTIGKADFARTQLSAGMYSEAIESGDIALDLSAEDAGNELSTEARNKCRLSAHLTVGLAHYYRNGPETALEYLQLALDESQGNPDAVCLLAQVLWAKGDEISRSEAKDRLFESVGKYADHVQSILLLGIVAMFEKDTESLEAIIASLQELRATHTVSDLEHGRIGEILRAIAALSGGNAEQATLTELQTDVFLHPDQPHGWSRLADLGSSDHAADMALKTAVKAVPPHGQLEAVDLSATFGGTGKARDIQKSILLSPWRREGWESLGVLLTGGA